MNDTTGVGVIARTKDYVILNQETTHSNYFKADSYFRTNIILDSNNTLTTATNGNLLVGDLNVSEVRVLVYTTTGIITLSGKSIILDATGITMIASTCTINALLIEKTTVQGTAVTRPLTRQMNDLRVLTIL